MSNFDPGADPEAFVKAYRDNDALLDAATDPLTRADYLTIRMLMRTAWKEWQGEDSLHEMAFGEPWPGEV